MSDFAPLPEPPIDPLILASIALAFEKQYGRRPASLHSDLAEMSELFDPTAKGGRIRERIAEMSPIHPLDLGESPWLILMPNGVAIVTPEGRAALEAGGQATWPPDVIRELVAFYRQFSLKRILSITTLLRGEGPVVHPAAIATILLLLVNRSTLPENGIPRDSDRDPTLKRAIQAILRAFIVSVAPRSKVADRELSLRSGYGVTEAARRLGTSVLSLGSKVFIHPGGEGRAIRFVTDELRRRVETPSEAVEAFDSLVKEYHRQRSVMSAAGCAFERSSTTESLRASILSALES